jgi:streptomycin 6-kinase
VTFPIPRNLAETSARPELAELRNWVTTLPHVVRELADRWALRVGDPFEPGGQGSWVAPVVDNFGAQLVLKVGWAHPEAENEGDGLRLWNGDGAVLLHAQHDSGCTSALLLERCIPGTWLKMSLPEDDQDEVVAGLLRRLWRDPPRDHPFRPLQAMCDYWADEFEQKLTGSRPADPGLARAGIEMFRALPASADRNVVLVTDLHGENILSAQRQPWLVVDPKPYVGDPAYDVLQHMLNCPKRLRTDPVGLARRMAELLDLDEERLLRWLFARCVQESLDAPYLARVAARLLP